MPPEPRNAAAQRGARARAPATWPLTAIAALLASGLVSAQPAQAPADTALAQANAPAAGELPPVVVTGTRSEREVKEVPATIESITAEQIEERQITDIREAAELIPNVSVERRSNRMSLAGGLTDGRSGNAGFNIRGLDGNRVLMLVDGIRAPRSYSFGGSSRDNVDFGLIERVEIIKGPSSALYGSDGIGGVVQLFTRDPASYLKGGKTFGGEVGVGYEGESNARRVGATLAGQAGPALQWLVSGSFARAHALENRGDNFSASPLRTAPDPERGRDQALLGKLVWTPNAWQKHVFTGEYVDKTTKLDLLSQYGAVSRGVTTTSARGATDNGRHRLSWQGRFDLGASWVDTVRTTLAYQRFRSEEHYENTRRGLAGQVRNTLDHENTLQANVQMEKTLRGGALAHKLTWGLDATRIGADNLQTGVTPPAGEAFPLKRFPDTTETSYGLFVQDEIIGNGWSVIPGLRWDRYKISADSVGFAGTATSKSGSALSPRLGATLDLGRDWTLYGQYASGFRTPGADQLNRFFENPIGFYRTVPNPNLKPEKAQHVEFGIKGRGEQWSLGVAVFHGRYRDFILDNQTVAGTGQPGDPLVFQAINIGNATISGFEVAGEYRLARDASGGQWSFPAAFGMARGKDRDTGAPINTIQPARLNLGVRYAQPAWSVRLDVTHRMAKKASQVDDTLAPAASQFLPRSSTTLDLGGQWRVWRDGSGRELRLTGAIHNLTNRKYWRWSDVQGLAANLPTIDAWSQPGRSVSVSLVGRF